MELSANDIPDTPVEDTYEKAIDSKGAGKSVVSPNWLTGLQRNWGGRSDVPVAGI